MDLLCCEGERLQKAYLDPVFVKDERVLDNLYKLEEHYTINSKYMDYQKDIKPYMRGIVVNWMQEVCEELGCEEDVFVLAVNYMDRFLMSYAGLKRNKLQLLASVCMFLSSKIKETYPISADKIVLYTDNSITLHELLSWELLVLCKLKWDLSAVLPTYFVDVYLDKIYVNEFLPQIRSETMNIINSCSKELDFLTYPPSMLAAACILLSVETIFSKHYIDDIEDKIRDCFNTIQSLACLEQDVLRPCLEHISHHMQIALNTSGTDLKLSDSPDSSSTSDSGHRTTPTDALAVQVV